MTQVHLFHHHTIMKRDNFVHRLHQSGECRKSHGLSDVNNLCNGPQHQITLLSLSIKPKQTSNIPILLASFMRSQWVEFLVF